jgi:Tol biopolymer transport system component
MKPFKRIALLSFFTLVMVCPGEELFAQYFGTNRPIYRRFDFDVYETPNFEIYHYFHNDSVVNRLAQASEQWYNMHYQIFKDSIRERNPLIFYGNHADFQQTTAIFGSVGVGTGGVTEALKNRVIMPVTETWAQTDHVLGHELVHAFQFNAILSGDSTNLNSLRNLPLWMIEGMAEYLSIGSIDPHTSMWMRDAVLNNDFPTLERMTRDPSYFPYRYGHAFWAFIGRTFGDELIVPIFMETAMRGYDFALRRYLGFDEESFSNVWKNMYEEHYKMIMKDTVDSPAGVKIIHEENAGHINISPAISPDGKYVAFYSEKDLFSIDLFLAEVETGRIIQKLSSTVHRNEIDALNFIESAGTWSPDSRYFAHIAYSKGRNKLLVVDVERQRLDREITLPNVACFNYPAWSPDGESIIVSGLVDGQNDFYQYYLNTNEAKQLTNSPWSNIHPAWSPDGRFIVYVTDRPTPKDITYRRNVGFYIAILDTETGTEEVLDIFAGASNLNPLFTPDGQSVYFLSDRDGFRNLYRVDLDSREVFVETQILTGISGITKLAPAISISPETGVLAYSYYFNGNYTIFTATPDDLISEPVSPNNVDLTAGTLPPLNRAVPGIVDGNLSRRYAQPEMPVDSFQTVPYRPKFKLDYIANSGVGVATSQYGTAMAGGVEMLFSDIIGGNIFHIGVALNGEIYDFGGQVTYINQRNRIAWGASVSHIPYSYGRYGFSQGVLSTDDGDFLMDTISIYYTRMFESTMGIMAQLPLSRTRRFETGLTTAWYNYRVDIHSNIYANGGYIGAKREKGEAPSGFALQRGHFAYVVDNSSFGIASPMNGARRRVQIDRTIGDVVYTGTLLDFRRYFFIKPISLAFKAYYYGRHGSKLNRLYPIYLGYPWVMRGYDRGRIYERATDGSSVNVNHLFGDQITTAHMEIRLPFTGPERLTVFKSKFFYTELALFADAGLVWHNINDVSLRWKPYKYPIKNEDVREELTTEQKLLLDNYYKKRIPLVSTGISLRFNLFGMLILEPFYAIPFQQGGFSAAYFGLNFTPGW